VIIDGASGDVIMRLLDCTKSSNRLQILFNIQIMIGKCRRSPEYVVIPLACCWVLDSTSAINATESQSSTRRCADHSNVMIDVTVTIMVLTTVMMAVLTVAMTVLTAVMMAGLTVAMTMLTAVMMTVAMMTVTMTVLL
jgi:hypothetical protein